jgi:ribosome modulation factor
MIRGLEKANPVFIRANADQMKAAFDEGHKHAMKGGSREKNPYDEIDDDHGLCWDTGWQAGNRVRAQRRGVK